MRHGPRKKAHAENLAGTVEKDPGLLDPNTPSEVRGMVAGKFRCNRPDCEPMATAVRCRCIPMHERSGGQVKHCHGRTQIEPLVMLAAVGQAARKQKR